MPTKTKPKPPAKPEVKATRKALLAYHSELQKYHEKLVQWETLLARRNEELMDAKDAFDEMVEAEGYGWDEEDEEDCECGPGDALEGCSCETCESWREVNPAAVRVREMRQEKAAPVGDEVVFLEKLFKLKDKRK